MAGFQTTPGWMSFAAVAAGLAAVPAQASGDRALGEYLSSECASCHAAGAQAGAAIPALAGMPADQFVAIMGSYRAGERENAAMRNIAQQLSEQEIAALAAYYAEMKPAR